MLQSLILGRFLEDGETITASFRRPFPLGKFLLYLAIFGGLTYVVYWYNYNWYYAYGAVALIGLFKLKTIFFHWYTKAILMTSESLMFTEWDQFTAPRSVRLDYWDLDAIEIVREGAAAWVGNFGDLNFGKISGGTPISFQRVWRPSRVESIISGNKEKMVDEKNFTEQSALKDVLAQMVDYHVRKFGQPARASKDEVKKMMALGNPLLASIEPETPETESISTTPTKKNPLKKIFKKKDTSNFEELHIEVEKELDDEGGISIELD